MKKIYLLGAALLSMTALAQATIYTVYNGTGRNITLVMKGDNVYGTLDRPFPLKKGVSKPFTIIDTGDARGLGPIYFAFTDDMKKSKYVVFKHKNTVMAGAIRGVQIDLDGTSSYEDASGRQTKLPRLMQTYPKTLLFIGQDIALGYFSRTVGKKVRTKTGIMVHRWTW